MSVLSAIYYFLVMQGSVRQERKPLLPFLGPFQLIIPQLWNATGNQARIRLIICLLLFGIFFGALTLLMNLPLQ